MEAGNRCFDQRVPGELNRKVLDHLSDINLVLTEHARRYLIAEGIRPETIIKTGSHMREVLDYYMPKIEQSNVLSRMNLTANKFFIVSAHREENIDSPENMANMVETLNALADAYDCPVIVSTHPRTQKRLDSMELGALNPHIQFLKPFGFCDYIKLQMEALCVVSDSGTITEEASLLNLPAITIRNAHERPEGMDAGTLIMSGLRKERVLDAVRVIIGQPFADAAGLQNVANQDDKQPGDQEHRSHHVGEDAHVGIRVSGEQVHPEQHEKREES
jgi:UDP-N-acetylglucosamine 2-epimerase (non-hydrolysing)